MPYNYAKMCFCDDEYLKLTFSRAVFVAWYMRLVFFFIFSGKSQRIGCPLSKLHYIVLIKFMY